MFARWASRTRAVNVLSPSSVQNGVDASVVLTLIVLVGISPICDVLDALAAPGVMLPTP
jgi:hypothetical protein